MGESLLWGDNGYWRHIRPTGASCSLLHNYPSGIDISNGASGGWRNGQFIGVFYCSMDTHHSLPYAGGGA